jgi:Anti-sigma-K factor rskA, C-terminal
MSDTPDPPDLPEDVDDLFAAFEAGEFDADPVGDDERRRMASAARLVRRAQPGADPPPELRAKVLERIRAEAGGQAAPPAPVADLALARARRARTRRLIAAGGALAAAAVVVAVVLGSGKTGAGPRLLYDAELAAVTTGPSPGAEGGAEITRRGADGYLVTLEAEGLAPNRGNSVYVLWYVGKGDSRRHPNRVSVGSFRTTTGNVKAQWPAAFDGKRFPRAEITLEPHDDGDPGVNGPVVARGPSTRARGK